MTIPPAAASTTSTTATASNLNLSTNQFLKLLTTQLQYQDPSNPISSQDFLSQSCAVLDVERRPDA